jgi:hypothetical protein
MLKKITGWVPLMSILLICCTEKKKETPPTVNPPVDTVKPLDPSKPDPKIAVKEDYSNITQEDIASEDITHLDISYFPANYALDKALNKPVDLKIRVIYSRANKKSRPVIFGEPGERNIPVPYGKIWRLGANESTEIELLYDAVIDGKKLKKGRYSLFAIPYPNKWTVIFNKDIYTWGVFNHNAEKNVLTTDVAVEKRDPVAERLYIFFQKTTEGANMIMTWDNVQVTLPIKILQ